MTSTRVLFESEWAARAAAPILAGRAYVPASNQETVWHGLRLFEVVFPRVDERDQSNAIESVLRELGFVAWDVGGSKVWRLPPARR